MNFDLWLTLTTTALLISISPGPGAINTINQSLRYGFKLSLVSVAGLQFGWLVHILVVSVGIGALVVASPLLFNIVKWIGVTYLVLLGVWQFISKVDKLNLQSATNKKFNAKFVFWQAFLVDITNIKGTMLLLSLLPIFLTPNSSPVLQITIIAITLIIVDAVAMVGYAILANRLRIWLKSENKLKWVNRLTGTVLILLATSLIIFEI